MTALSLMGIISQGQELPSKPTNPIAKEFDKNRNGKIDIEERKAYVHEVARQQRAEARELARNRPRLTPQERLFYSSPKIAPDVLARYDTNQNGKLDLQEKIALQHDAGEHAKAELRAHDKNGDGKLSKEELVGVKAGVQRKRAVSRKASLITESPQARTEKADDRPTKLDR